MIDRYYVIHHRGHFCVLDKHSNPRAELRPILTAHKTLSAAWRAAEQENARYWLTGKQCHGAVCHPFFEAEGRAIRRWLEGPEAGQIDRLSAPSGREFRPC